MSFNTDNKGLPVAVKKYSPHSKKNQIISLDNDNKQGLNPEDIEMEHLELIYGKEKTKRKKSAMRLKEELIKDLEDDAILQAECRTKDDAKLEPLPDYNLDQAVWFLSGPGGSGKSYFSTMLMNTYRRLGIKKIFVITTEKDDKFGKVNYLNVNDIIVPVKNSQYLKDLDKYKKAKMKFKYKKKELIDEGADLDDIIELEIEIENMKPKQPKNTESYQIKDKEQFRKQRTNSLFLFDDYENDDQGEKYKKICFLRDFLLTNGRHTSTNLIICNHLTNPKGGRLILSEAHYYVLFNKATDYTRNYFLEKYLGFDKDQRRRIKRSLKSSRWVCICPSHKYCLYQHLIYLFE